MTQEQSIDRRTGLKDAMEDQDPIPNEVSDETGKFDPRFNLWRKFCADQGIDVNTLPGDLSSETKDKWEKLKEAERLPGS